MSAIRYLDPLRLPPGLVEPPLTEKLVHPERPVVPVIEGRFTCQLREARPLSGPGLEPFDLRQRAVETSLTGVDVPQRWYRQHKMLSHSKTRQESKVRDTLSDPSRPRRLPEPDKPGRGID